MVAGHPRPVVLTAWGIQAAAQELSGQIGVVATPPSRIGLAHVAENAALAEMDRVDLEVTHIIRPVLVAHELAILAAFNRGKGQQHIGGYAAPDGGVDYALNVCRADPVQRVFTVRRTGKGAQCARANADG